MSIPLIFNYNDEADYDFPATIEVTGGETGLKLLEDNVDFTEDFADETGHTYESDKSEFIGGLNRQIDKRPANCIFFNNFKDLATKVNPEDSNWGNGTQTGTLGGSASVHDDQLDLTDGYAEYPINNFTSMTGNIGWIQFEISFDYSGVAPNIQYIIQTSPNTISRVYLAHNDIYLQCYIFNNVGALIYNMTFGWTPNVSTIYNFAIGWTGSNSYFFINGQLQDSDTGSLDIGEPSLFRIGGGSNTAFQIYNIAVFNTLQHSSNYTPSWSNFYDYVYLTTSDKIPEMEHTGDGSILAFNLLSLTYSGSPRILLDIDRSGDDLYWNVDTWSISDGSYDQATDLVTFNAHCDILDVIGGKYGQFTIVYPNSNTISAVSELTANMLVNIGYSTANPLIKPKLTTKVDGLEDWEEVVEKSGSDDVKAICELNGVDYYYNGSAWAESSGYSQSNSVAEVLANKDTLLVEGYGKNFRIGRYLHSADGSTTPKLDTDTLSVNFSGISPTIKEIFIYGNLRDIIEGLDTVTIYYRWPWSVGGKVVLTDDYQEYETFPEGYFEISIKHEDGHPPAYFEFKIKTKLFRFEYPSDELLAEGDYIEIGDLNLLFTKRIVSF